jgi:hypothetical protein
VVDGRTQQPLPHDAEADDAEADGGHAGVSCVL